MRDNESGGWVEVPGLGEAWVRAGVDFYDVCFGREFANSEGQDGPPVVVNGKTYEGPFTVSVLLDGGRAPTIYDTWCPLTDNAKRKVRELVTEWAAEWIGTAYADSILAPVVQRHNEINRDRVRDEIVKATNHLRELEQLLTRFDAVDSPTEYVETWATTYELRERS